MQTCPFKTGDWVIYQPTKRGQDLDVMASCEDQLRAGQKYKVCAIERGDYVMVERYKHPGGGIYWSEFVPVNKT